MFKNSIAIGKATGKGEWQKVIDLAKGDDDKVYSYIITAYAYEQLKNINMAKKYYHLVLQEDENYLNALEQISMIYATEKNHGEAYKYMNLGLLHSKFKNNYMMKVFDFILDVIQKTLHPTRSFYKMRKESLESINWSNDWIRWALEYKNWYEKNIQK